MHRTFAMTVIACVVFACATQAQIAAQLPQEKALSTIAEDALREDLTFLASDAMKGRDTPSPELDLAADWIGERFKTLGLLPAFGDSYFQGPRMGTAAGSEGRVAGIGDAIPLDASHILSAGTGASLKETPLVTWNKDFRRTSEARRAAIHGKALLVPPPAKGDARARYQFARRLRMLADEGAVAVLVPLDPEDDWEVRTSPIPLVRVPHALATDEPDGTEVGTLDLTVPVAPSPFARNVGAILKGSDPDRSKDVLVFSAHYDHVGVGRAVDGDSIYNGADDDATGTVAVLAIAKALASLPVAPKRTCLFLCFYGEEKGMLGSRYYVEHAALPLRTHKAVFNLEMLGRPDDIPPRSAWITGWRVSDFGDLLAASGKGIGITFYEHPQRSRMLFGASDNISFAVKGIPAHSISAGSLHKDYHKPSDDVSKIDFSNMAAVTRGIAQVALVMADGGPLPTWSEDPRAAAYREAHGKLHQ